jgi:M6 family metalloprotease-like protein
MKKYKHLILSVLLGLTLGLTSCDGIFSIFGSSEESVTLGEYAGHHITLNQISDSSNTCYVPSTGDSKIVVIPVYFSDYTPSDLDLEESEIKANLEACFFGASEDTGWESVSSFYKKSSYNQLNLDGIVTDCCPLNETLSNVASKTGSSSYYDPTYYVLEKATTWFKQNYSSTFKDYDTNSDGYLDGIWLVYLNPYMTSSENLDYYIQHEGWSNDFYNRPTTSDYKDYQNLSKILWAYTYWNYDANANYLSPNSKCYAWASYSFLSEGGYSKPDAHTFIHETGHMLGLDDYYSYDSNDAPVGGLCMMDNNIGDHEAFSKYLLSWISPRIIKETGTYTLGKFSETGDSLLIPANLDSFNDSPYSEYLLLQYYTPDGLNAFDSEHAYTSGARMFTTNGVLVYHVDARLMVVRQGYDGNMSYTYTNWYQNSTSNSYVTVAASNTASYSYSDGRLVTLISALHPTGKVVSTSLFGTSVSSYYYSDRSSYRADNRDVFTKGKSITSFDFESGYSLKYDISVTSVENDKVTITIA